MLENLTSYKIILASQSPRRRKLIEELGLKIQSTSVNVNEKYPNNLSPEEIALFLAKLKANAFLEKINNLLLITADTIVALGDKILEKPLNRQDAYEMLSDLSGKEHKVITGVCLKSFEKEILFSVTSKVSFSKLTDKEIYYYIDHYKPYDKAGSYGIQEWIGYIGIDYIEGSFYNVMGLPVHKLYQELKKF